MIKTKKDQKTKSPSIQYRYVRMRSIPDVSSFNLAETLNKAMKTKSDKGIPLEDNWWERARDLSQNGRPVFINEHSYVVSGKSHCFFGCLVKLSDQTEYQTCDVNATANCGKEATFAEDKLEHASHVANGRLYFIALDNHVAFITEGISEGTLEKYITALFQNTNIFTPIHHVTLAAKLAVNQNRRVDQIATISVDVVKNKQLECGSDTTKEETPEKLATTLYESLGISSEEIDELQKSIFPIKMIPKMIFGFVGQKNKTTSVARTSMDVFIRNIPEDQLSLKGPDGLEEKGTLKVSTKKFKIDYNYSNGSFDIDSVKKALLDALEEWKRCKVIGREEG